jgi:surface carbohydrate biosynthesis protein
MIQTRPRIALVVDHPERDLPGLVLTAVELCRRGAVCHLVPANLAWKEVWSLGPDFTLFNYFRRSNEPLGRSLAEAGLAFGALDTEGGVWPDFNGYTELLWSDRELRRAAACVCIWGRRMAEHLVEQGWFDARQVSVTGCPRFDFYHADWQGVIEDPSRSSDAGAPQILINTNFSTRNPRFATVEQKIETSIRNFGWSMERIRTLLDTEEQAIGDFIRLAARFAGERPDCRVLVRPHPFEDPSWYRRELQALPNVTVDNDGPVQPALFGSAAVVQRSCTTGIEAGFAGRPTFSPQWVPAPWLMPAAEAVSVPCASLEQLTSHLHAVLDGRYTADRQVAAAIEQVIDDWFCAADGSAYRRVADTVLAALPARRPRITSVQARHLFLADAAGTPLRGAAAVGGRVRLAAGLSPDFSFRSLRNQPSLSWTRTTKFFDAARVQTLIERVHGLLQRRETGVSELRAVPARVRGDGRQRHHVHAVTVTAD